MAKDSGLSATKPAVAVAVWDWPTRLFHWALAGLIVACWFTAEQSDLADWHLRLGEAVLGLLIFRFYWGVFGSSTARFTSFVRGPRAIARYGRSLVSADAPHGVGHNPIGAVSVLAMLAILAALVASGLFSVDVDGLNSGPLAGRVSFELGRRFAHLHHLAFEALEALVVLHLAAIAAYWLVKRSNLLGPMLTGRARGVEGEALEAAPLWRLIVGLIIGAGAAWLIGALGG